MKVVIVGSGEMLMSLIAGCQDYGCKIVGVMLAQTNYMNPIRLFIKNIFNPAKDYTYIKSHNLYELKSKSVNSEIFKKEILRLNADIVLVGSWGEKFKKESINLPKLGTINVHPSLLPKYRGPNPYIEVIRNMEKETGVTFHLMNEELDSGAILTQERVEIKGADTGKELKTRVCKKARETISKLLQELDNDIIIPIEQNKSAVTYYKRISEKDLILNFDKYSAEEISAQIRALHPFAKAHFANNSHYLIPNPYGLEILENKQNFPVGTIYETDISQRSISVVCADNKVIKMYDVKLLGYLRLLTDLYIKLRVKTGTKI